MIRTLAVACVVVSLQTPAYPCGNVTIFEGDEAVRRIVQVEAALDAGNPLEATGLIARTRFRDQHTIARLHDARMLAALRHSAPRVATRAIDYFANRQDAKNIKHRAWLAEAYAAAGKREDALKILVELRARDLMPDGFAWLTLAKLSTGADVDAHLETCRKRAKNRTICVIKTRR